MLLSRKTLLVVGATAKETECRGELSGVLVEPDGSTVATDGIILLKVTPARSDKDKQLQERNVQPIDDVCIVDDDPLKPVVIPSSVIKEILQSLPTNIARANKVIVVLDAHATNTSDNILVAVRGPNCLKKFVVKKFHSPFPNYRKVIPDYTPKRSMPDAREAVGPTPLDYVDMLREIAGRDTTNASDRKTLEEAAICLERRAQPLRIGFMIKVLSTLLKTLSTLGVKAFYMEAVNERSPVKITCKADSEILALIMPCI